MATGGLGRSVPTQQLLIQLRTDILLHRYRTGDRLREVELAQRYGVSRTVIRGALLLLEREGLIQVQKNGTRLVTAPEARDIEDLYELRRYLESSAVSRLTAQKERNLLPILRVAQEIAGSEGRDVCELLALDAQFHRSVIEASGNRALLQAWDTIEGVMQAFFRLNMSESQAYQEWFVRTFRERHGALFAALLGEGEAARALFLEHIGEAARISARAAAKAAGEEGGGKEA